MARKRNQDENQKAPKNNGRQEVTRTEKGRFALGNASGGRPKGIGNRLTEEIRTIIDENKDVFLHRLFRAAGLELDNYIRVLEGNDYIANEDGLIVQLENQNMSASILVNQLVLKSLPQVKHIDITKTEQIMAAIVNLTGREAVNYLEEKEDLSV